MLDRNGKRSFRTVFFLRKWPSQSRSNESLLDTPALSDDRHSSFSRAPPLVRRHPSLVSTPSVRCRSVLPVLALPPSLPFPLREWLSARTMVSFVAAAVACASLCASSGSPADLPIDRPLASLALRLVSLLRLSRFLFSPAAPALCAFAVTFATAAATYVPESADAPSQAERSETKRGSSQPPPSPARVSPRRAPPKAAFSFESRAFARAPAEPVSSQSPLLRSLAVRWHRRVGCASRLRRRQSGACPDPVRRRVGRTGASENGQRNGKKNKQRKRRRDEKRKTPRVTQNGLGGGRGQRLRRQGGASKAAKDGNTKAKQTRQRERERVSTSGRAAPRPRFGSRAGRAGGEGMERENDEEERGKTRRNAEEIGSGAEGAERGGAQRARGEEAGARATAVATGSWM